MLEQPPGSVTTPASHTRHLAVLDGLRGIAIALVMLYHFWLISWFPSDFHVFGLHLTLDVLARTGMTGVTVFFFVSGFCLFYPYAQARFDGRALQTLPMFAYRRILKIVPSYYLGIALWIVLGFAQFSSFNEGVRQVAIHAFFLHGFWNDTEGAINGVLWSLATEVEFYVLFPAIAWAAMRKPLWTFATMIAIGNLWRLVVVHHTYALHEIDFVAGALDVFGAGMLAAWCFRYLGVHRPRLAARKALWTTLALVALYAWYQAQLLIYNHKGDAGWNVQWYLYGVPTITLSVFAVTLGSLFAYRWWQSTLANPILLLLSYLSYNLYLWHQILAVWLAKLDVTAFRQSAGGFEDGLRPLYTWMFFALAMGVAWLITTFVEQPLLRRRPFVALFERRRARTVAIAIESAAV